MFLIIFLLSTCILGCIEKYDATLEQRVANLVNHAIECWHKIEEGRERGKKNSLPPREYTYYIDENDALCQNVLGTVRNFDALKEVYFFSRDNEGEIAYQEYYGLVFKQ